MHRKARRAGPHLAGRVLLRCLLLSPHRLILITSTPHFASLLHPPAARKWYPAAKMAKRVMFLLAAALLIAGELFKCNWSRCLQAAVAHGAAAFAIGVVWGLKEPLTTAKRCSADDRCTSARGRPCRRPWLGRRPPPDRAGPRSARRHRASACSSLSVSCTPSVQALGPPSPSSRPARVGRRRSAGAIRCGAVVTRPSPEWLLQCPLLHCCPATAHSVHNRVLALLLCWPAFNLPAASRVALPDSFMQCQNKNTCKICWSPVGERGYGVNNSNKGGNKGGW